MIQISFDRLPISRNATLNSVMGKKIRIKEWWQKETEKKLTGYNVKYDQIYVDTYIYFKVHRRRDYDNYMSSLAIKGIHDGIVSAGLIPDDTIEYLSPETVFCYDKKNPRTEVRIYGKEEYEGRLAAHTIDEP